MDQGGDTAPSPIVHTNVTSTVSDTNLDVESLMLVEGREDRVAKLVASGMSATTKEDSKYLSRKSWSLNPQHKVFLSHAGPQKDFVEQLCEDLIGDQRFGVFFDKDEECLPKGLKFPELILQAARQCELAVVVMSEDYFTHKWPMIELSAFVEAQKLRPGLNILPLFYKLSVEEFKQDERQYIWLECWRKLAQKDPRIDIQKWRDSLKALSPINGIEFVKKKGKVSYRKEIVKSIRRIVTLHIRANDSHIQGKVRMSMMIRKELGLCDELLTTTPTTPRFVGMYGMSGIGKTTLCKLVCDDLFQVFDGKAYHVELGSKKALELQKEVLQRLTDLHKVTIESEATDRLKGLSLLKENIPRHKVFLAIDNVWDTPKSLEEAEDYLSVPFREGSVVLVTACTIDILKKLRHSWQRSFQVPDLQKEEATTLFAQHAKSNLAKLSGAEKKQIEIFVEACHFTTGNVQQYHPLALKVLGTRVGADSSKWKDIVVDFKRSHEKKHPIFSILRLSYDELTEKDQKMFLDMVLWANFRQQTWGISIQVQDLIDLFDHLYDKDSLFVAEFLGVLQTKALVEVAEVSDNWLYHGYAYRFIHIHELYREFVRMEVESEHRRSCQLYAKGSGQLFQKGWLTNFGAKLTSLETKNLCHCSEAKILIMKYCYHLTKVVTELDVRGMKNLTILEVDDLPMLSKARVEDVDTLVSLKLVIYGSEFPSLAGLKSLRQLEFSCPMSLMRLQDPHGTKNLGVQQPPDFGLCTNLEKLSLRGWRQFLELPGLGLLEELTHLELQDSDKIEELPGLEALSSLQCLSLLGLSSLKEIPHLSCFPHLRDLILRECQLIPGVSGISESTSLEVVDLSGCVRVEMLPNMCKCTKLRLLHLKNCPTLKNLESIGELPALRILDVLGCRNLVKLPNLRGSQLTKLDVRGTSVTNIPGVDHYTQLEELYCSNTKLSGLPDLSNLHKLSFLDMTNCSTLEKLDNIGKLPALKCLGVSGCPSLVELPDLSYSKRLTFLDLSNSRLVDPNRVKLYPYRIPDAQENR